MLFAHVLASHHYQAMDLLARLAHPALFAGAWSQLLGTGELGRDVLTRLLTAEALVARNTQNGSRRLERIKTR